MNKEKFSKYLSVNESKKGKPLKGNQPTEKLENAIDLELNLTKSDWKKVETDFKYIDDLHRDMKKAIKEKDTRELLMNLIITMKNLKWLFSDNLIHMLEKKNK